MARKLKRSNVDGLLRSGHSGAFDESSLGSWGSKSNLFHQGFAKEVDDPEVIAATMLKPGVILRRPVGSNGPFKEHADLPTHLSDEVKGRPEKPRTKLKKQPSPKMDDKAARTAALAFEREQRQRESERRKEEAATAK